MGEITYTQIRYLHALLVDIMHHNTLGAQERVFVVSKRVVVNN